MKSMDHANRNKANMQLLAPQVVPHKELLLSSNADILKKKLPFYIRLLEANDINQIIQLRKKVFLSLKNSDSYVWEENEYDFLLQHCGEIGETFGIFSDKTLIAYAILGYHSILEQEDFSTKIRLPLNEINTKISHLVSCMVDPAFQTIGLHKLLVRKRITLSLARGYSHCVASASPSNHFSRHNLFRVGFRIHWAGTLPNNPLHYYHLLHVNLREPRTIPQNRPTELVLPIDFAQQQTLLDQGYFGYRNQSDSHTKQISIAFILP